MSMCVGSQQQTLAKGNSMCTTQYFLLQCNHLQLKPYVFRIFLDLDLAHVSAGSCCKTMEKIFPEKSSDDDGMQNMEKSNVQTMHLNVCFPFTCLVWNMDELSFTPNKKHRIALCFTNTQITIKIVGIVGVYYRYEHDLHLPLYVYNT